MKTLLILFSLILIGCNGERERSSTYTSKITDRGVEANGDFVPEFDNVRKSEVFVEIESDIESEIDDPVNNQEFTQDIIERSEEYTNDVEEDDIIDLDIGFKEVGNYGIESGCPGKIYRRDYDVSYLYVFVDCKNNYTKQIVRK